jgi:hypothetical protein
MSGWGNESWGHDPWGSSFVAPPGPGGGGDGHLPYAAGMGQTLLTGSESVQIELSPTFDFTNVGKTQWTWHICGEMAGISAGKSATFRVRRCPLVSLPLASCPVIGTITRSANGIFHSSFTGAIPAGSNSYLLTRETDSVASTFVQGMLLVVEIF